MKKYHLVGKIANRCALGLIVIFAFLYFPAYTQNQLSNPEGDSATLLKILPAITFAISIIVGILNLFIINRLNKSRDEILSIVRNEVKEKISSVEQDLKEEMGKMATKEQMEFVRTEFKLMLQNIELKIDALKRGI